MSPLAQLALTPLALAWLSPLIARFEACASPVRSARLRLVGRLLGVLPLGLALYQLAVLAPDALSGAPPRESLAWIPAAGMTLALRLDALALVACGLILVVGLVATLAARGDTHGAREEGAHMALVTASLWAALSDDLSGAVSAIGVAGLVAVGIAARAARRLEAAGGRETQAAELRRATRLLWTLQAAGGAALLVAGALLEARTGTHLMSRWTLTGVGAALESDLGSALMVAFFVFGGAALTGLAPLHLALPPLRLLTPGTASLLTSATLAPAGLLLLARLAPALSGHRVWLIGLGVPGLLGLFVGAYQATRQQHLRGILAYGAVSQLGLAAALLAIATPDRPEPAAIAVMHLAVFGLARAVMFAVTSEVAAAGGSEHLGSLGGLRGARPALWLGSLAGTLALSGLPPLFTFFNAHAALAAGYGIPALALYPSVVPGVFAVSLGWTFAWTFRLGFLPFFGKPDAPPPASPLPGSWLAGLAIAAPITALLVAGASPELLRPTYDAMLGDLGSGLTASGLDTLPWPAPGAPLVVFVGALIGGTIWFAASRRLIADHGRLFPSFSALDGWERVLRAVSGGVARVVGVLARGGAAGATLWLLAGVVSLVGWTLGLPGPEDEVGAWWLPSRAEAAWDVGLVIGLALTLGGLWGALSAAPRRTVGVAVVSTGLAVAAASTGALDVSVAWVACGAVAVAMRREEAAAELAPPPRLPRLAAALVAGGASAVAVWATLRHHAVGLPGQALASLSELPEGAGGNLSGVVRTDILSPLGALGVAALAAAGLISLPASMSPSGAPLGLEPDPIDEPRLTRQGLAVLVGLAAALALVGADVPGAGAGAALLAGVAAASSEGRRDPRGPRLVAAGLGLVVVTGLAHMVVAVESDSLLHGAPATLDGSSVWAAIDTGLGLDLGLLCVALGLGASVRRERRPSPDAVDAEGPDDVSEGGRGGGRGWRAEEGPWSS
jgi:NADH:ubiquinone oxidoreductase subunit 5 (subunit L)/multisubunit Na+/H+ antiporter MnhA subunit